MKDRPFFDLRTRRLDAEEIHDLMDFIHPLMLGNREPSGRWLPHGEWTDETRQIALDHLLTYERGLIAIPQHLTKEITYAKLTWG